MNQNKFRKDLHTKVTINSYYKIRNKEHTDGI